MSKQKEVRLTIRELMNKSENKHLSYNDIMNIVYFSQFGFLYKVINDGDRININTYKSVLIRFLGSFIAHPKRVDLFIKRHNKE